MDKHSTRWDGRGLLIAVLLAVGCTDSSGPEQGRLATPLFDVAAGGGIAFDVRNETLNQRGQNFIIKGFNPTNPRNGDAIIATFFWVGSAVITAVTDHLTDPQFTPVGNTYTLVDSVTAGGISMATYVATNVQNIPVAKPDQSNVYAVRANMSATVIDGGVMLSAWSGVAGTFAAAVGANRSAVGTGSGEVLAGPGPIAVDAGALAYAVTMSNGKVGRFPPSGFGEVVSLGDDFMATEGDTVVQAGAGSVDPQWRWFFGNDPACTPSTPCTWLATVLALNPGSAPPPPPPPPPPSNEPPVAGFTSTCNALACSFTSSSFDNDGSISGYSWDFGDGGTSTDPNPSHTYGAGGTYLVTLTVTDDLGATSAISDNVTVIANRPPAVNAGPDETAVTGLLFTESVSFTDPDNDGPWSYRIDWGDGKTTTGSRSSQGSFSVGHTYVTILLKTFTIRVTVTDSHGASGSDTKSVKVLLL